MSDVGKDYQFNTTTIGGHVGIREVPDIKLIKVGEIDRQAAAFNELLLEFEKMSKQEKEKVIELLKVSQLRDLKAE